MEITSKQKQYLRGLAHALKPVVQVGLKGVAQGQLQQIAEQLRIHELIKVRFNTESGAEPGEIAAELAAGTDSHLVQKTGRIVILYRAREEAPTIKLPTAAVVA